MGASRAGRGRPARTMKKVPAWTTHCRKEGAPRLEASRYHGSSAVAKLVRTTAFTSAPEITKTPSSASMPQNWRLIIRSRYDVLSSDGLGVCCCFTPPPPPALPRAQEGELERLRGQRICYLEGSTAQGIPVFYLVPRRISDAVDIVLLQYLLLLTLEPIWGNFGQQVKARAGVVVL